MDLGLADATAVVTGGSKGMGRAVAEVLAADGARVAVMARGREALDETVEALLAAGAPEAFGVSVDMTDARRSRTASPRWRDAGPPSTSWSTPSAPARAASRSSTTPGWDEAFTLGTMSCVRSVRAALPSIRAAEWGRICIFSAHSVQRQSPLIVAYTAAKSAVSSISKNLAKSLAPEGILVNTICPGTIVTASFTENLREIFAAENLDPTDPHDVMHWIDEHFHQPADVGRAGLPDEVATITAYLVSRRNGYVTGASVNVDGGSDFI